MPGQLLYFNPDPQVPDADLLGFGDLIYSDGRTEYLSGDPELASELAPLPPGMSVPSSQFGPPQAPPEMGPPQAPPPPIQIDGMEMDMTGNIRPMEGVQDPNTGELLDPGQPSNFLPALASEVGNAAQGYPEPLGQNWQDQMGGQQSAPGAAPPPPPVVIQGDDGQPYTLSPTGEIQPGANGVPIEQLQRQAAGGGAAGPNFQPYERSGALPADMAARQLGQMGAQNQAEMAAYQQARADEARLMNQATLQQMATLEAQRIQNEEMVQEEQQKVARWQQEQQRLIDMDIETDLISARGPVGGVLAAAGAALLGAAGNDAGFRMIEKQIDQHVRLQVGRRDTKLGLLAQEIGNSQQAIKLGKAALYKAVADRSDLLMQKTKHDVFEAQTPAMVEKLRGEQMKNLQEAEKLSIGKTIERIPLPPKPPSPEALQKYGELRRERQGNDSITQRMDQTLGLVWAPGQDGQPGRYVNKDEVLKKGIQGTGNLEQLIPDIVYATGGGVTAEGRQVRGAAEAMAFAQLRAVQPTGPISNSDIERAVKMGALDTEEGLLLGLERMHNAAEQQLQHDAAQFGPDIVSEYERRRMQSGGMGAPAQPAASRPATVAEKRGSAEQLRGQGKPQEAAQAAAPEGRDAMTAAPPERMAMLAEDLQVLAGQELGPEGLNILLAQAAHETADGARLPRNNFFGHKASGRSSAAGRGSANLETTEGEGAAAKRVKQNFSTFNTSTESAADHISLLKRKYPRAWEALEVGDPDAYVAALKDGGYFTGNEDAYRTAILRRL